MFGQGDQTQGTLSSDAFYRLLGQIVSVQSCRYQICSNQRSSSHFKIFGSKVLVKSRGYTQAILPCIVHRPFHLSIMERNIISTSPHILLNEVHDINVTKNIHRYYHLDRRSLDIFILLFCLQLIKILDHSTCTPSRFNMFIISIFLKIILIR